MITFHVIKMIVIIRSMHVINWFRVLINDIS
jgi:hypothetical protein